MENSNLKVYVWDEYNTDYYAGLAVAVASSIEEAKDLVRAKRALYNDSIIHDDDWGIVKIYGLGKCAFEVDGGM